MICDKPPCLARRRAVQGHHVAGVDARRRNRFGQRVLCLLFGDVVGVGRQRQHIAAMPQPLRYLDEVDSCGKP